jgi:hypothetical protein
MKSSTSIKSWACVALVATTSVCGAATTHIGKPLKFYEASSARLVSFALPSVQCTPSALMQCVSLNSFGTGSFTDIEVANVTISPSSDRSMICLDVIGSVGHTFKGYSSTGDIASVVFQHRYEIESAVLANPRLTNKRTGLPFGGKIVMPKTSSFADQDRPGSQVRQVRSNKLSSFDCGNPLLNYSMLVNTYGLPPADAERLMAESMTINMYLSGHFMSTEGGYYSMQLRIIGD